MLAMNFSNESETCGNIGLPMCSNPVGYSVVIFFITMAIIGGNVLNLCVLIMTRRLHNNPGYFMMNLAITDLGAGLVLLTTSIPLSIRGMWPVSALSRDVHGFFAQLFVAVSIATLSAVSFDRYLSISHPLQYLSLMTTRRCILINAFCWALNILTLLAPFFGFGEFMFNPQTYVSHLNFPNSLSIVIYSYSLQIVPGMLVICVSYGQIFKITKRHIQDINTISKQVNQLSHHPKRSKAIKTMAVIVIMFFICWIPYCVQQVILALLSEKNKKSTPQALDFILTWLAISNSFMNSIIYCVTYRDYRLGMIRLLSKIFCIKRETENDPFSHSNASTVIDHPDAISPKSKRK
jgi:hypothetical protein